MTVLYEIGPLYSVVWTWQMNVLYKIGLICRASVRVWSRTFLTMHCVFILKGKLTYVRLFDSADIYSAQSSSDIFSKISVFIPHACKPRAKGITSIRDFMHLFSRLLIQYFIPIFSLPNRTQSLLESCTMPSYSRILFQTIADGTISYDV